MEIQCKNCGKPVSKSYFIGPALLKKNLFCSRSCSALYRHKIEGHHHSVCRGCGTPTHGQRVYCRECRKQGKHYAHRCEGCGSAVQRSTRWCKKCRDAGVKAKMLGRKCQGCDAIVPAKTKRVYCDACIAQGKGRPGHRILALTTMAEMFAAWSNNTRDVSIRAHARKQTKDWPRVCAAPDCRYTHYLETCHLQAVSDFPLTATVGDVNAPQNLVLLCPNHHWDLDHGLLNRQALIDLKGCKNPTSFPPTPPGTAS